MSSLFVKVLDLHQKIYEGTRGVIGHRLLGKPTLLLRTTGRRTGTTRTVALVYGERDGARLVVPSNGGADRPPAWLRNIQADPRVEVQIGTRRRAATATVIEHDDPRFDGAWKQMDELNGGRYDEYQAKTKRPIPIVALT